MCSVKSQTSLSSSAPREVTIDNLQRLVTTQMYLKAFIEVYGFYRITAINVGDIDCAYGN